MKKLLHLKSFLLIILANFLIFPKEVSAFTKEIEETCKQKATNSCGQEKYAISARKCWEIGFRDCYIEALAAVENSETGIVNGNGCMVTQKAEFIYIDGKKTNSTIYVNEFCYLGDHTATQNINLGTNFYISPNGGDQGLEFDTTSVESHT